VLFGYAIRTDVDHVRLAIVDPSPDASTLALRSRFEGAGVFDVRAIVPRTEDLDRLFQADIVQQGIVFEPDFASHLREGEPAQLLIVTDGTEPNTASLLQLYAQAVVIGFQSEMNVGQVPRRGARGAIRIVPEIRTRFNPTRESVNLFVPGLMAFVLTIISSLMTAISLTREKETGTLEALLVSPLRPWSIIIGKVFPYLVIGFASALLVIGEARLIFHVPLRGSVVLLLSETLLFVLASLALGILISSRSSSQRVAMLGAALVTMLPNLMLSGFIFPIESMPLPLRLISHVVVGRWFVEIARGIMLKGVGLQFLWRQTAWLAGLAAVLLAASARSFKPRLD
jgi:ABC-2 type transport system permease protein